VARSSRKPIKQPYQCLSPSVCSKGKDASFSQQPLEGLEGLKVLLTSEGWGRKEEGWEASEVRKLLLRLQAPSPSLVSHY
jgi:hypothetical protein